MFGSIAKKTALSLGCALVALAGVADAKTVCANGPITWAGTDAWGSASTCNCGIQIGGLVYGYRSTSTGIKYLEMNATVGAPTNQLWAQVWAVDLQGNGAWVYPTAAVDNPGGSYTIIQWGGYPDRSWSSPWYLKAVCAD
jgi:hypothetical protein